MAILTLLVEKSKSLPIISLAIQTLAGIVLLTYIFCCLIALFISNEIHVQSATRRRWRRQNFGIFIIFGFISLLVSVYIGFQARWVSHLEWTQQEVGDMAPDMMVCKVQEGGELLAATVKDEAVTNTIWRLDSEALGDLRLWLSNESAWTKLVAGSIASRRGLWWMQQWCFGMLAFGIFTAGEGRKRGVRPSLVIAIILLAGLMGLSVGVNLLAAGLVSVKDWRVSKESHARELRWRVCVGLVLAWLTWLVAVQYGTEMAYFAHVVRWMHLVVPLTLIGLLIIYDVPSHAHKDGSSVLRNKVKVFRLISIASSALYLFQSLATFLPNTVPFLRSPDPLFNSATYPDRTILEKLAAVPGDGNLIISTVAWDVLLSSLTLCTWSVLSQIDVEKMLDHFLVRPGLCHSPTLESSFSTNRHHHDNYNTAPPVEEQKNPMGSFYDPLQVHATSRDEDELTGSPAKRTRARGKARIEEAERLAAGLREHRAERKAEERYAIDTTTAIAASEPANLMESESQRRVRESESAALSWVIYVFGGLGAVSASVFGAETLIN